MCGVDKVLTYFDSHIVASTAPSRALISITGALHVVVPIREHLNTAWPHHQPLGQAATRVRV